MANEFNELKAHELNPRSLSKHQGEVLYKSLTHFGDLSGIVFNVANGKLVGGHMRTRIFEKYREAKQIHVTQKWDQPKSAGTVAIGYVGYGDEYYAYREVMWDETTHLMAMEAANQIGGDWDLEKKANVNELIRQQDEELLKLTGQSDQELEHLRNLGSGLEEETKPEDNRESFSVKLMAEQATVVDQAINEVSAIHTLGGGPNDDLRGNALELICQSYLDNLRDDSPTE